jgi:hypothetical protein
MREHGEATNGDAVDIIENEGLGYAVQCYTSGDDFKDPKTAMLWTEADKALGALVAYLERETGREID